MVNGKEITIGAIIVLFIGIIVVLAILPEIGTQTTEMTTKNSIANETVSIATARNNSGADFDINSSVEILIGKVPTGWKITQCPISSFSMTAENGTILVSATDYTFTASTGTLTFMNTSEVNQEGLTNVTTADYAYCLDGYITSGGGRSMAGLIVLFSALALVAFAIFFALKYWL